MVLDAEDGTVLFRKNLTDYQTQSATYNVYTATAPRRCRRARRCPAPARRRRSSAARASRSSATKRRTRSTTSGWMTDGVNEHRRQQRPRPASISSLPTASRRRSRVRTASSTSLRPARPTSRRPARIATAKSRTCSTGRTAITTVCTCWGSPRLRATFRHDNFGRGGAGQRPDQRRRQDFVGHQQRQLLRRPPTARRGRMQMYIFPGPTPDRTSALDHDVLLHELTHGTSNRLHNNATGLAIDMSRGMGEGWSRLLRARAALDRRRGRRRHLSRRAGGSPYQIGPGFMDNYYYGIRRFPYAVRRTVGRQRQAAQPADLCRHRSDCRST